MKKILLKTHKYWSRIVPSFYRAYQLPTGGKVYIDISESNMMFARVFGMFEPEKHRALDFFLSRGDAYIDVGANKGEFAIHAALAVGEEGKVIAFEPEPKNHKWIIKSILKSNINNIKLERLAIGKEKNKLKLFIGEKSGFHSLVASSKQNLKKDYIEVDVLSLDEYLKDNPIPNLKAVKIDVEGFEKEVLLGASEILRNYNELVIFVDIHPSHGVKHSEIYEILYSHGFKLFKEKYPFTKKLDEDEKPLEFIAIKNK